MASFTNSSITEFIPPPWATPTVVKGVTVTQNTSGDVSQITIPNNIPKLDQICGGVEVVPSQYYSARVGTQSAWSYTLNFSSPIKSIKVIVSGCGQQGEFLPDINEDFEFVLNSNKAANVSLPTSCLATLVNNLVLCGKGRNSTRNQGAAFVAEIISNEPFTKLTISGKGGAFGSNIAFADLILPTTTTTPAPTTTTTTTTPAPTTTTTTTTTTTPAPTTTTTTTTTTTPAPTTTTTTTTTPAPTTTTTTTTLAPCPDLDDPLNSIDVLFDVLDYKDENTLSSYSLNITPLKFIPRIENIKNAKILWNFGDGTSSEVLTAVKSYDYPGKYYVNLVVYDCFNNAKISIYTAEIMIYDYLPHNFSIDTAGSNSQITLSSGKITGPWRVIATYPTYQNKANIFYEVEGSKSAHHQMQKKNKYGHLENTYGLYDKFLNKGLNFYQFREIDSIEIPNSEVYVKTSNNTIVQCSKTDDGAEFAGISGYKDIYFKDDTPSNQDIVRFYFDKTNIYSPTSSNHVSYFNTTSILLSCEVVENTLSARYSITSNGLDGEYYSISSFDINPIQFEDSKLYFIIKLKDNENFSIKTNPISSFLYNPPYSVYIVDDNLNTISENISAISHYKGASKCYINLSDLYINENHINGPYSIYMKNDYLAQEVGRSSQFYVYPKDYYKMSKKHEDFNMGDLLKDLRFQESLVDKTVLFDDFLGAIYNQTTPIDDNLGAKLYEKISNFVENTQDVDRNEISALISQIEMLDGDILKNVNNYPESIKRILNLISISKNKLNGYENKFASNFDVKGYSSKDIYGKNIGNQITTLYYTITAGKDIVALEKFSNNYKLLNTYIPLSAETITLINQTYPLSSYNTTWGWPLVLPSDFTSKDFDKYYSFFEYVSTYDGTITDFTLDFNNSMCTIPQSASYNDLYKQNGIFDYVLKNKVRSQLSSDFKTIPDNFGKIGIADPLLLDIQFSQDKTITSRKGPTVTFSRTQTDAISGSTYLGADGLIKYAASNQPRFTHHSESVGVSGACWGLLLEESKTNLLKYSIDFSQSIWPKTNSTVEYKTLSTLSPDGAYNATLLSATGSDASIYQTLTGLANTSHTFSVWAKAVTNLGSATVTPSTLSINLYTNVGIDLIGSTTFTTTDQWQRFSVTATYPTSASEIRVYIGGGNSFSMAESLFIWGAQMEPGNPFTSYIPTISTARTRGQDICIIDGQNIASIYNQSEGTIFCAHRPLSYGGSQNYNPVYGFQSPNRVNGNIYGYFNNTPTFTNAVSLTSFSTQASFSKTMYLSSYVQSALALQNNNFAGSINGSIGTDNIGILPTNIDRFVIGAIGNTSGQQIGNNIVDSIQYYRKRLSNETIQELTTYNNRDVKNYINTISAVGVVVPASQETVIDNFVRGVKAMDLWDNTLVWPMGSGQNAGSGTKVYGLGGLGTYNVTVDSAATWETSGISLLSSIATGGSIPITASPSFTINSLLTLTRGTGANTSRIFTSESYQKWGFRFGFSPSNKRFEFWNGESVPALSVSNAFGIYTPVNSITYGVPINVTLTFDAATGIASIYLNGTLSVASTSNKIFIPPPIQTSIGLNISTNATTQDGLYHNISFYNRALSPSQVSTTYKLISGFLF